MRRLLIQALAGRLRRSKVGRSGGGDEPPWMAGFGALSDLGDENRRILDIIEDEFERLPPEDAAR